MDAVNGLIIPNSMTNDEQNTQGNRSENINELGHLSVFVF